MIKLNIKIYAFLIIGLYLLTNLTLYSQQNAQFTHYMYNMSSINPSYATDKPDVINLGGLYRMQWVGVVGAPRTGVFFIHLPMSEKVETGLSVINDNIGNVVSHTDAFIDFAYLIKLRKNKLSFGLKGGATFFETNFNGFELTDNTPDPLFSENINRVFPNIGAGMFYFSDHYYIGLSAPNLLETKHSKATDGIYTTAAQTIHYFFTGGYVFDINPNLKVKPAFMIKAASGVPLSVDLTSNVLFFDVFELGVAYRIEDSFSGLANFKIAQGLRIGYAYDHTLSNLGRFNSGSHEFIVLFDLYKKKEKQLGYDKSPRFF